jgi:hypothetical protein
MSAHLERMESIQAMLAAGHRCVELERHSLLLWGGVGGGLCAFTDLVINGDTFPDNAQRAVAVRSEERRVGKECRRLCRSRWSPYH